MNIDQVLQTIKDEDILFLNFWFVDIFGELHQLGMPSYAVDKQSFENVLEKLDASSIFGFISINNSDKILKLDAKSFRILSNDYDQGNRKNAVLFYDLYEGNTVKEVRYNWDSREIAHKDSEQLKNFGLIHTNWGPKIKFHVDYTCTTFLK